MTKEGNGGKGEGNREGKRDTEEGERRRRKVERKRNYHRWRGREGNWKAPKHKLWEEIFRRGVGGRVNE